MTEDNRKIHLKDAGDAGRNHNPPRLYASILRIATAVIVIVIIAGAFLMPHFQRATNYSPFGTCRSNLKNIGTALEMYSTDNEGKYPDYLAKLTPDYLKTIPGCPAARAFLGIRISMSAASHLPAEWTSYVDTYSRSYCVSHQPDMYTLMCGGNNHPEVTKPNYPQYSSFSGAIDNQNTF